MSMNQLDSRIRERAYEIWQADGCPEGCENQHWERAARDVLATGQGATGEAQAPKTSARAKSAGAKGRMRKAA